MNFLSLQMLELRVQNTKGRGELCSQIFAILRTISQQTVQTGCSYCCKVFKLLRNQDKIRTQNLYVENLEPKRGEKPRPTLVGFSHNPLNGQKALQSNTHCYKVTHTRPTSLAHMYLVFPRQATMSQSPQTRTHSIHLL